MMVDVIPTLKELTPQKIYGKTVIVLDIYRCTSTIVTALACGCKKIIPALDAREAAALAAKLPPKTFFLAGEINGAKIPGFDLGNSPLEYTAPALMNKAVILTTTNGTHAIRNAKPAKHILIGSFLNLNAACSRAVAFQKDIVILCSGTSGNIALEDIMAAGCHVSAIKQYFPDVRLSDLARTFYYLYRYFSENLVQILATSRSALNLQKLGRDEDISFCLQENLYRVAPVFRNNAIQLSQPNLFINEPSV